MAFLWPVGFLLVLASFLNVPDLRIAMPPDLPVGPANSKAYFWLGCALLAGGFAWFRPILPESKMSRPAAWAWFTIIMAVAAYLRLSHFHDPAPFYWDDYSMSMVDSKSALDLPTERYLVFEAGCRQPFYQYWVTLFYFLFPNTSSLELQNITWALIDLTAVWIHYLLGREVGGRRVGLLLAALVAVTKPTLLNCMTYQSPVTTPLSVGLMLLFTWRYCRQPDLRHALQWGASLAFGAYCYNAVRPFMGFLPFVVLVSVLWKHRQRADWGYRILGVGSLAAFSYLFFQINRYVPTLAKLLHLPGGHFLPVAALFVLGILYLKIRNEDSPSSRNLSVVLSGIIFAVILAYPLISRNDFAEWTSGASIFRNSHEHYPAGGLTAVYLWGNFTHTIHAMFIGFTDRWDMALQNEPFYNLQAIPVVLLGYLWALIRFDHRTAFWLACALIGILPFTLSHGGHSGRLVGTITPSFLLGAMGIDAWWVTLRRTPFGRIGSFIGLGALVAFGAWNVHTMDYRFYTKLPQYAAPAYRFYQDMRKIAPGHRVYLADAHTQTTVYSVGTLADKHFELYRMDKDTSAAVPVPIGQEAPNVALYFSPLFKPLLKRVLKDFPQARIETIPYHGDPATLARVIIPGKDILPLRKGGHPPLFYRIDRPSAAWRRIIFYTHAGLGMGIIASEEFVDRLSAPLPIILHLRPGWAEGVFNAPQDGYYRFSTTTSNFAILDVAEKRNVLDLRPLRSVPQTQEGSVYLKTGAHPIRIRTYFQSNFFYPPIQVFHPGQTTPVPLETSWGDS